MPALYAFRCVTDLLAYRDRFPILRDCTYLINHSLAAMPAAAEDNLLEYARMWRERGIRAWGEGWWEMPITVGDQIGRIIGAPPGSTVMHQNVTVAEEIVLSCFRQPGARNRVVYEEANFPSVRYLYQAQPDLEVVAVEDDAAIVDAIDERTLLVPISPRAVQERGDPGRRADHPARARGRRVRRARLLPVGGRRAVRRHRARRRLRGRRQRQVALRRARARAGSTCARISRSASSRRSSAGRATRGRSRSSRSSSTRAGARRFLTGTPNVPALYAATAGYDVIEEVGVERIRERSLALTQLLIDLLDARRLRDRRARASPARRGGTVLVRTPDDAAVHRELGERGIICDFRPDAGIRLGPHFFNTEDELAAHRRASSPTSWQAARTSGTPAPPRVSEPA